MLRNQEGASSKRTKTEGDRRKNLFPSCLYSTGSQPGKLYFFEDTEQCLNMFLIIIISCGVVRGKVQLASGRDQGCCQASCSVERSPPQQRVLWPHIPLIRRLKSPASRIFLMA